MGQIECNKKDNNLKIRKDGRDFDIEGTDRQEKLMRTRNWQNEKIYKYRGNEHGAFNRRRSAFLTYENDLDRSAHVGDTVRETKQNRRFRRNACTLTAPMATRPILVLIWLKII